jgi:hypothetical protein
LALLAAIQHRPATRAPLQLHFRRTLRATSRASLVIFNAQGWLGHSTAAIKLCAGHFAEKLQVRKYCALILIQNETRCWCVAAAAACADGCCAAMCGERARAGATTRVASSLNRL